MSANTLIKYYHHWYLKFLCIFIFFSYNSTYQKLLFVFQRFLLSENIKDVLQCY